MKSVKFSFLLIAAAAIAFSACKKHASSVSIQPKSKTIGWLDTLQLAAQKSPADAIELISWTSSDATIASIDTEGKVIGKGAGNALIVATCGDFADTCQIEVLKATKFKIVQNLWNNAWVGDSLQLLIDSAKFEPRRYLNLGLAKIKWQSGNPSVVSVSGTGKVDMLQLGDVWVYAICDELKDSCRFIINHQ